MTKPTRTAGGTSSRSVGLFAKPPRAGMVKSRLVPPLTEKEAAELYNAFLGDLAGMLEAGDAWRWWVYSTDPEEQGALWVADVPRPQGWRQQVGADLGDRMHRALAEMLTEGAEAAVLIGSDHPTLSAAFLEEAFDRLENVDVVLGPSQDGGYYLVGTRRPQPTLFEGIAWSTAAVLEQTLERIRGADLRAAFLPPWYDVDTAEDLRFLRTHLEAAELGATLPPCPRTRSWLARHPAGTVSHEEEKS